MGGGGTVYFCKEQLGYSVLCPLKLSIQKTTTFSPCQSVIINRTVILVIIQESIIVLNW